MAVPRMSTPLYIYHTASLDLLGAKAHSTGDILMATKTKPAAAPAKRNANRLHVKKEDDKSKERMMAEIGLSACTLNTLTARSFSKVAVGETDLTESISVMFSKVQKIKAGDLSDMEATLAVQVVSLNSIFNEMARRASLNMGEYLPAAETYLRLALKAQAQCARTVEVLAAMKNPTVVFAKQANIAHGHQQVNNGNSTHTGKPVNQENELLEVNHGSEKMDTRTAQTAGGKDPAMATLDTIERG